MMFHSYWDCGGFNIPVRQRSPSCQTCVRVCVGIRRGEVHRIKSGWLSGAVQQGAQLRILTAGSVLKAKMCCHLDLYFIFDVRSDPPK